MWKIRYCKGHEGPQVVYIPTHREYSGFCAECERDYNDYIDSQEEAWRA